MIKKILITSFIIAGFSLLFNSKTQAQICTPDQILEPAKKCTISPGFPGSTTSIPLNEVPITATRPSYYFPLIPAPFSGPYFPTAPNPNAPGGLPCPGDIIKNPTIAPSSGTNFKGGTYGLTRNGGTKFHDGVDIKATPGTPVFSPENGIVTGIRGSFAPDEYKTGSYGNYVEITYIVNGVTVTMSFNHLNGVETGLQKGSSVSQGQLLGESGRTGNAGDPPGLTSGVIPHVHIRTKEDGKRIDPEKYLKSNFDKNTGLPSKSPC